MKWAFTIQQKVKAALMLGVVFLMVFAKNWFDERNVAKLGNSFASVYEDRLLVESYIYQLSDHLYQKKIMLDNCSAAENLMHLQTKIETHNAAIDQLVLDYGKTKLTPSETTSFSAFKENIGAIKNLESTFLEVARTGKLTSPTELNKRYGLAVKNLHELSQIQVTEGKILNDKSKQIIAGSSILTQLELAILIGIGLLIQGLIFAARSAVPRKTQNFSLN
jgi:hypothetical protein